MMSVEIIGTVSFIIAVVGFVNHLRDKRIKVRKIHANVVDAVQRAQSLCTKSFLNENEEKEAARLEQVIIDIIHDPEMEEYLPNLYHRLQEFHHLLSRMRFIRSDNYGFFEPKYNNAFARSIYDIHKNCCQLRSLVKLNPTETDLCKDIGRLLRQYEYFMLNSRELEKDYKKPSIEKVCEEVNYIRARAHEIAYGINGLPLQKSYFDKMVEEFKQCRYDLAKINGTNLGEKEE
jgi:hypothetical protein